MATLADQHPFLPQMPDVGRFVTSEEEQGLFDWLTTRVEVQGTGVWTSAFYGSLAAVGLGALVATVWSDVPVVRTMQVHTTPTRTVVTSSLIW